MFVLYFFLHKLCYITFITWDTFGFFNKIMYFQLQEKKMKERILNVLRCLVFRLLSDCIFWNHCWPYTNLLLWNHHCSWEINVHWCNATNQLLIKKWHHRLETFDNQQTMAPMNKNYSTIFSNHLLYKINLKHITHPSNIYIPSNQIVV